MKSSLLSKSAVVFVALMIGVATSVAQDMGEKQSGATLKVGDKAPALAVEKWVKGDAVKGFESGKAYVVEFWATWCGPCIASMPHLTALQAEYKAKGVTIISCTSADPNNTLEKVEAMVKEKGDGMGYTVAWDTGRKTYEAYMQAAGQNGIPCSFLIDKTGTIAWIGHPMFLDMPLDMVASGSWDPKTGPATVKKAEEAMNEVFKLMRTSPKDALAAWDKLEKDFPKVATQMSDMKFQLLLTAKEWDKAYTAAKAIVEKAIAHKDSMKLNEIAWTIVDPEATIEKRDLDLALTAATKANEFSGDKDPAILDTLARVYATKGDYNKAIEIQKKAVDNAKGPMQAELKKALTEYEAKVTK